MSAPGRQVEERRSRPAHEGTAADYGKQTAIGRGLSRTATVEHQRALPGGPIKTIGAAATVEGECRVVLQPLGVQPSCQKLGATRCEIEDPSSREAILQFGFGLSVMVVEEIASARRPYGNVVRPVV